MGRCSNKSFTLIELLLAIVVLAILASLVMPVYTRRTEKTYERTAINDLQALRAAQEMYQSSVGKYYNDNDPGNWQTITKLNTNLGLNLVETGIQYQCQCVAPCSTYVCRAYRPTITSPVWALEANDASLPFCQTAPCPTCTGTECP